MLTQSLNLEFSAANHIQNSPPSLYLIPQGELTIVLTGQKSPLGLHCVQYSPKATVTKIQV